MQVEGLQNVSRIGTQIVDCAATAEQRKRIAEARRGRKAEITEQPRAMSKARPLDVGRVRRACSQLLMSEGNTLRFARRPGGQDDATDFVLIIRAKAIIVRHCDVAINPVIADRDGPIGWLPIEGWAVS